MPTKPVVAVVLTVLLALALAAVPALAATRAADGALLTGAGFALSSPERCLAAIAIGLAAATGGRRRRAAACGWLALGALAALSARATPVWPLLTEAGVYARLHLLGPVAAALAGLVLVLPDRWRAFALPPAAAVVALALTLTAVFNDPDPDTGRFARGAALAAVALPLAVALVLGGLRQPWFGVPERIAGSWCLATGLLLAGVQLVPARPPPAIAEPAPPPAAVIAPNLDPMLRPQETPRLRPFPGLGGRPQSY